MATHPKPVRYVRTSKPISDDLSDSEKLLLELIDDLRTERIELGCDHDGEMRAWFRRGKQ